MDKDFLLKTYGQCYGSEAGPWNLSVENKYLEYKFAKFFEDHFTIPEDASICNIGIGAGYWDRYLSYKPGKLISIDIDGLSCRQLEECLVNECNPNSVRIIHSDVMLVDDLQSKCDIVTMVGSARMESGLFDTILEKAFSFLKPGGAMYYQTLDEKEKKEDVLRICDKNQMQVEAYELDEQYGFRAQFWKISKAQV